MGSNPTPSASSRPLTLYAALTRYAREYTPTKRGAKQEAQRIRLWQHSSLACRSLASLTTYDLAQWRNKQVARGKAPSTVRNKLTILSQLYKVAISEWGCEGLVNPVANLRLPKQRPGRDRRLEGDEEARLLEAAQGLTGAPWFRPLLVVLLETGMRRSEALGLSEGHIQGTLAVLPRTKNGRSRTVPLSTRARAAAAELLPHLPVRYTVVEWYWKRALSAAHVEGLTMHDLRHEAVSRLFERGLTTEEVMAVSGHRTYAMLARYTHLRVAGLVDKLG